MKECCNRVKPPLRCNQSSVDPSSKATAFTPKNHLTVIVSGVTELVCCTKGQNVILNLDISILTMSFAKTGPAERARIDACAWRPSWCIQVGQQPWYCSGKNPTSRRDPMLLPRKPTDCYCIA